MIYLRYLLSELRRRRGRTVLTALGLGVGVALVIAVNSLSAGLTQAQQRVLEPLTGVGTDMTVNRPISVSGDPRAAFQQLSAAERAQLRKELGFGRDELDFGSLTPGSRFTRTTYRGSQFSFPATEVAKVAALPGISSASGGLTLSVSTISGVVPNQAQAAQSGGFGHGGGDGGGAEAEGGEAGHGRAGFAATTVTGVDPSQRALGPIAATQLAKGSWFSTGAPRQAILDLAYAKSQGKTVGSTISLGKNSYRVVGLVKSPLGGQSSNVYLALPELQTISGRAGRVNTIYVRAASAGRVDAVAAEIRRSLTGASVTTAKTLASRVTGSLADARKLTDKLGLALEVIGLLGAVLIASLLTLASIAKRTRELGTLRALGWPRRLVVRQVAGESLAQGLLGGVLGIALGLFAALLITLLAPTLQASVAAASTGGGFEEGFGAGDAAAAPATQAVRLGAQVSPGVIALAVVLALAAGLVAGAAGAVRAARLRPVEALRHID